MPDVTIFSKHECHLCDVVLRIAQQVQTDAPFVLTQIKIDGDARLLEQYGMRVPVVVINGQEIFAGKVTEGEFRRAIQQASRKSGILFHLKRIFKRVGEGWMIAGRKAGGKSGLQGQGAG